MCSYEGTGVITEERRRELLTTMGDRWSDEQVDDLLTGAPVKAGQFNYAEFTKQLKHGTEEADDTAVPSAPAATVHAPAASVHAPVAATFAPAPAAAPVQSVPSATRTAPPLPRTAKPTPTPR